MKTSNYKQFKFMHNNRKINAGLVNRLIKSIQDIGYVESRPVIVDSNYVIIDGQHRFEACKKLGIDIVYQVEVIDKNKAMVALNMNQAIWRLNEYVDSWAESGITCYQEVVNFEKKYGFGISNSISICFSMSGSAAAAIRKGSIFEVNPNRHLIADFIKKCNLLHFYKTSSFVRAIILMWKKTTNADRNKLISNILLVNQQATTTNYLSVFENIINKRKKTDMVVLTNN